MKKYRLEAFSDAVIAILITIMVLSMEVPQGVGAEELLAVVPVFLTYVLSFIYLAIYWSNHHHLFQAADRINRPILWANLNLLFWLSLIPFATGWMGENHFAPRPAALYGVVLLLSAVSYWILRQLVLACLAADARLSHPVGRNWKGWLAAVLYLPAIVFAGLWEGLSLALYVFTALLLLIPDRRLELALAAGE